MKKIEYLLKKNRSIQAIYIFVFSLLFKFIGLFIRVDKKLILFNSFGGKLFNDSPKVLYEAIKKDERFKDYKLVWAFKEPKKFKDVVDCTIVKQDFFRYFIIALKARYWITNVNIERGLKFKRKRNICLNTWHGTGPKTIGNAVKGRKDYNFSNIDFLLADGEFLKDNFIKNFNANPENIYLIGRPREDCLFECKKNLTEARNKILEKMGYPKNKKYVLFAPTWRETSNGGKSYDIGFSFDLTKWSTALGEDYIILFRAHSITNSYNIPSLKNVIDVTSVPDINLLYIIADILVSDYSSCFADFSILEKPIFCYAPDYEEYRSTRGLLFDLEPFYTSGVIKDEDKFLNAIINMDYEKECENSRKYNKHFVSSTGKATQKSLDLLLQKNV